MLENGALQIWYRNVHRLRRFMFHQQTSYSFQFLIPNRQKFYSNRNFNPTIIIMSVDREYPMEFEFLFCRLLILWCCSKILRWRFLRNSAPYIASPNGRLYLCSIFSRLRACIILWVKLFPAVLSRKNCTALYLLNSFSLHSL